MKTPQSLFAQLRDATRLLKDQGPLAATAAIQRVLSGGTAADDAAPSEAAAGTHPQPDMVDINPPPRAAAPKRRANTAAKDIWKQDTVLKADTVEQAEPVAPAEPPADDKHGKHDEGPADGQFLKGSFAAPAGTRAYRLYVPSSYAGQPLPLVVMLHGCKQNPEDFAAGTRMNAAAEQQDCFVLYPAQPKSANGAHCWNWFQGGDQHRGRGEPAIIAGMTQDIMRQYQIDPRRVYVAGLSAGGAMAAILAATYPELYAALGIHSGLPYGAAHDVQSAFAAMKHGTAKAGVPMTRNPRPVAVEHSVPIIVFHGDRDATVHPANGDQALAQFMPVAQCSVESGADGDPDANSGSGLESQVQPRRTREQGQVPNGRSYTRTVHCDANGSVIAEHWRVHGAGHAWAGGSREGSYTDPKGPSATREMLRFFFSQRQKIAAAGTPSSAPA
jgi:poly(hydroxyalkanoate) depolymerase family esterase